MKTCNILFFGFILLLTLPAGCSHHNQYADVIELNRTYIDLIASYISDLDKADNAGDTAKAMNRFADKLEPLWKNMERLNDKYPELRDMETLPEPLRKSFSEAEEMGRKMSGSFIKIIPYMEDPEVRKAQQRLANIMNM